MHRFRQLLIRGGSTAEIKTTVESKDTAVHPPGTVLGLPQGTYVVMSLSCFADTETSTR